MHIVWNKHDDNGDDVVNVCCYWYRDVLRTVYVDCWYKAVTIDGLLYEVSGVMSGGLADLLGKSSQWTVSSERAQARVSNKRAIQDELKQLSRLQVRRRQPSSQIAAKIDAQKKLLQVAEEQKNALVRLFEEFGNLLFECTFLVWMLY